VSDEEIGKAYGMLNDCEERCQALEASLAYAHDAANTDTASTNLLLRRITQLEGALKGMIPRFIELMNFYKRAEGSTWTTDFDIALQHAQQVVLRDTPVKPPYKEWCRTPETCRGLSSCPLDPTCAD
jgi:hypothetical protein